MIEPTRHFLFLQGPHGPWFHRLGGQVRAAGGQVWRVGFNLGDRVFWPGPGYIAFDGCHDRWPESCAEIMARHAITDLVVYGDTRPIHAQAIRVARARGLTVHVFEEGYLRPYWVTYERDGSNGHSRLMDLAVRDMQAALARIDLDLPDVPATWGDMRQHMFWGALYHGFVALGFQAYANFRPHRALTVGQEFRLYLKRFLLMPLHRLERRIATLRIRNGGFPFHLAILQLEHDSSFRDHSPFASMTEFLALVIEGFAKGAPRHHHLVFKAHPLEDGRVALKPEIRRLARLHGVSDRVHFVRGGKLARLMNDARSAVTVNSTAGQQALWRGLPLRTFGGGLCQAGIRLLATAGSVLCSPRTPRHPRLPRLPALPFGNLAAGGRLLLRAGTAGLAASGCRSDAFARRSLSGSGARQRGTPATFASCPLNSARRCSLARTQSLRFPEQKSDAERRGRKE